MMVAAGSQWGIHTSTRRNTFKPPARDSLGRISRSKITEQRHFGPLRFDSSDQRYVVLDEERAKAKLTTDK